MGRRKKSSDFRRVTALSFLDLARVLGIGSEEIFNARDFADGRVERYSFEEMKEDVGTLKRYAHALGHDFESNVREGLGIAEVPRDYTSLLIDIINLATKTGINTNQMYAGKILDEFKEGKDREVYSLSRIRNDINTISMFFSYIMMDRESLQREKSEVSKRLVEKENTNETIKYEKEIKKREIKLEELRLRVESLEKENHALLDCRRGDDWLEEQIGFEDVVPLRK